VRTFKTMNYCAPPKDKCTAWFILTRNLTLICHMTLIASGTYQFNHISTWSNSMWTYYSKIILI